MQYRPFGKTGELVSALGFGCMRLPTLDGRPEQVDRPKAEEMFHYAVDHGVNFFDTAYTYHTTGFTVPGSSEPFLGDMLANGLRDRVLLSTKLPPWALEKPEDMERILNHQLERLRTDHIDCYLLHGLGKTSWAKFLEFGALPFLDRAIAEGKIRYAGFSFHDDLPVFESILAGYDWSFCLLQYNYMDVDYQQGGRGLRLAADRGLGVMVMEPLKGGKLAQRIPEPVRKLWGEAPIRREPVEWALRFVWDDPGVGVVLSGMSDIEQMKKNVELADQAESGVITPEEMDVISRVREEYIAATKVDCTRCKYCMPCPAGIDIPLVLGCLNDSACYGDAAAEAGVYGFYVTSGTTAKASDCTECGQCEDLCPQHLPIRDSLKEAAALFDAPPQEA